MAAFAAMANEESLGRGEGGGESYKAALASAFHGREREDYDWTF